MSRTEPRKKGEENSVSQGSVCQGPEAGTSRRNWREAGVAEVPGARGRAVRDQPVAEKQASPACSLISV